jgi:hypothetical protein
MNLSLNPNNDRQRKFREKQRNNGLVQKQIWVHKKSYEAGKWSAENGLSKSDVDVSSVEDLKSWRIGFITSEK